MANDKLMNTPVRDGFLINTLQRMVGKIGDILTQQKVSRTPSPAIELAVDPVQQWNSADSDSNAESPTHTWDQFEDVADDLVACRKLALLIESALRDAKSGALSCGEVLIPADLTVRVARDIIRMAEKEPCGLRGCVLLLNYEDQVESRRIGQLQYDPATVGTFELLLTLKKDMNSWLALRHFFPFRGCLRKLGKGSTIVVSPGYTLVKRKLYRSSQQT